MGKVYGGGPGQRLDVFAERPSAQGPGRRDRDRQATTVKLSAAGSFCVRVGLDAPRDSLGGPQGRAFRSRQHR